jgi:N-methylhydantoinase A/oxoprolinase/acetone carboxylase beta subunit
MVRAIDVRTIGLGGDSEVALGANGRLEIRPQRIVPVSLLAARFPETLALLEADLADVDGGGSMHGRFVLLPFGATAPRVGDELSPREAELLHLVRPGPQPLRALATSMNAQRAITALQRKGLIQVAGFTPSDAGHVLDLQANWSRPAAYMAAHELLAAMGDLRPELIAE